MRSDYDYTDDDGTPLGRWELISCQERDGLLMVPDEQHPGKFRYRDGLCVFSGYTDVPSERYTEWGEDSSPVPLVFDHRREGRPCEHGRFVPVSGSDEEGSGDAQEA